ncbi:MAG: hypothetical protein KIS96_03265 [Bauldia sp.]|nr:hypothetical protein [Bauldia sp.]
MKKITAALAAATILVPVTAMAAGNLASQPTFLETSIDGAGNVMNGTEFELETGKYYIWTIESDGILETLIQAPELFRNAWFNQVIINDKEIHSSGSLYGLEFDGPGTLTVGFVPIRPGVYPFFVEEQGFSGTMTVTGSSMSTGATPLDVDIDGSALTFSTTEFELETGKAYNLRITSDGVEELMVQAPALWRNSWINQIVIDGIEVKVNGAFYGIEWDDEGTVSISFVPLRPGNYEFFAPGYQERGMVGTMIVR